MASGEAQHVYLTDQQGARSPHSQSPPLSSHSWSSDCLGGQQAGHVCFFTSFLQLACSCFSIFQPKQLPEVGEGDELGRSILKAALPSSSWLMNSTSPEDKEDGSISLAFLSPLPSLGWQR